MTFRLVPAVVGLVLFTSVAGAQTSYPMITHCTPVAVQRGTTAEVLVEGQMNFTGVHKVLIEGRGVSAEVIGSPPPKGQTTPGAVRSVRIQFKIDADAPLGVREFRLASSLGISTLGQLLIVADPVVVETGDNNVVEKAQTVKVPCIASGRIEAVEDVDYFRFAAKGGQTFTFEVVCARIQDKIHDLQKHADPLIVVLDAAGRELAASDDAYFADPLLTFTIPKDGEYVVQVRDAKYDGDPRWAYALLITDRPHVSHVFPMAGNPGRTIDGEPVGSARLVSAKVPFVVPAELGVQTATLDVGGTPTNPAAFVVTTLPLVTEHEPNDTPSQATKLQLPGGVNGRIGQRRDLDHFVFRGDKGKAVRFEVFARRFGTLLTSQLDSDPRRDDTAGAVLATNDDAAGKDAALVFTPPADGDYVVRVRDLNNKGGDGFVYYLEADWARPDFTLKCDPSKAMIGPGSRTAWYVQVNRAERLHRAGEGRGEGTAQGRHRQPADDPAIMTQGLLVLSAAADAPIDAAAVEVVGTAEAVIDGKATADSRTAVAVEEIYLPGGGRGRFDVGLQAVAVTGPSDILEVQVKTRQAGAEAGRGGEDRRDV